MNLTQTAALGSKLLHIQADELAFADYGKGIYHSYQSSKKPSSRIGEKKAKNPGPPGSYNACCGTT